MIAFWIFSLSVAMASLTDEQVLEKSENLLRLRAEVEALSEQKANDMRERKSEMDLLVSKKTDLQASVMKEKLRALQLSAKMTALQAEIKKAKGSQVQDFAFLQSEISRAEKWLDNSLPWNLEERREKLLKIKGRIASKEVAEDILRELSAFLENEMTLSSTNQMRIQDFTFSEGPQKAELIRLGFYRMFFKKSDGSVGEVSQQDSRVLEQVYQDPAAQQSLDRLFKKFKDLGPGKKLHGFFELPDGKKVSL